MGFEKNDPKNKQVSMLLRETIDEKDRMTRDEIFINVGVLGWEGVITHFMKMDVFEIEAAL